MQDFRLLSLSSLLAWLEFLSRAVTNALSGTPFPSPRAEKARVSLSNPIRLPNPMNLFHTIEKWSTKFCSINKRVILKRVNFNFRFVETDPTISFDAIKGVVPNSVVQIQLSFSNDYKFLTFVL